MKAADLFHVGIVADDPQKKMQELTELFGYEWGDVMGGAQPVTLPSGDTVVELLAWYSLNGPRLEIVQSVPGTIWVPAEGSGIHHLGYWADDIEAESAKLEEQGYAVEAVGQLGDGKSYWAYHLSPEGPRIEIVSSQLRPMVEQYFETGTLPMP
ncbi:VOC family protein [Tomitella biformata]|uniref:VOC family protein n=1 Tax=Tomitella biformata TaxID=630403 RepID=UPI0004646FC4|nr:VOC family protein [Tomitella biformata]